jgi:hypothetical protein
MLGISRGDQLKHASELIAHEFQIGRSEFGVQKSEEPARILDIPGQELFDEASATDRCLCKPKLVFKVSARVFVEPGDARI